MDVARRVARNFLLLLIAAWVGTALLGFIDGLINGDPIGKLWDGVGVALYWGTAGLVLFSPVVIVVLVGIDLTTRRLGDRTQQRVLAVVACVIAGAVAVIGSVDDWAWLLPVVTGVAALILRLPPPRTSDTTRAPSPA